MIYLIPQRLIKIFHCIFITYNIFSIHISNDVDSGSFEILFFVISQFTLLSCGSAKGITLVMQQTKLSDEDNEGFQNIYLCIYTCLYYIHMYVHDYNYICIMYVSRERAREMENTKVNGMSEIWYFTFSMIVHNCEIS